MSIVGALAIPFEAEHLIELGPSRSLKASRITVVIGENGTRKSFMLRELVRDGLNAMKGGPAVHLSDAPGSNRSVFLTPPRLVIAVSAVPTDRFPAKRSARPFEASRLQSEKYVYVGPRTAMNLVSRSHAAKELALQILLAPERLSSIRSFARRLLKLVDVGGTMKFGLNYGPQSLSKTRVTLKSAGFLAFVESARKSLKTSGSGREDVLSRLAPGEENQIAMELDDLIRRPRISVAGRSPDDSLASVHVDFVSGSLITGSTSNRALAIGIATGFLTPTKLWFDDRDHDSLSAGQWNLASSLLAVAMTAEDNTLVLVDEPENGLHPEWQRNYLPLLADAMANHKRCHVVLATHAPLVVSSMPLDNADLVKLKRTKNGISASIENPTAGWDAGALLEDIFDLPAARGEVLIALFDRALGQLAQGIESPAKRKALAATVESLRPHIDVLPAEDPLRSTFVALSKAAKE